MIPIRIPLFLYKLKNKLFPKYFIYSFIAAGGEVIYKNLGIGDVHIEKLYAKAAIKLILAEKLSHDPHLLWACSLLACYHWKYPDIHEMEKICSKFAI
ncbi:hypothetical protein AYI69_g3476 [Smittium culicis]|uniref:Uncharacterized protein n=1 Tax=Smittium culicis TaxID=133412 RepID=A0A1R1YJL1_9FUNG|nr:hypothetical protein AYI69_g3476 [Smittium culicis]